MKCLLFSDLHIHSHKKSIHGEDRLQDCLNVLEWVFDIAIEKKVSNVFFLGDLFHDRQKIDVLNYLKTFEVFFKYLPNAPFRLWLLVGNHDMYHKERWDINSVKPLSAIPNVEIIDKPSTVFIDGYDIDFLPHTENPLKELKKLSGRKLLFSHLAVDGASLNTTFGTQSDVIIEHDGEMVKVSPGIFNEWEEVYLGHYHGEQHLSNNVEYIGSPLQLSFGEAFQTKHIIYRDLKSETKEYIINNFSPKHYIINQSDLNKYDLSGNFVRIIVEDIGSVALGELKKEVLEKKPGSLDFKQKDNKVKEDENLVENAKDILFHQDEMLETYLEQTGFPENMNKEKLLTWGSTIVSTKL